MPAGAAEPEAAAAEPSEAPRRAGPRHRAARRVARLRPFTCSREPLLRAERREALALRPARHHEQHDGQRDDGEHRKGEVGRRPPDRLDEHAADRAPHDASHARERHHHAQQHARALREPAVDQGRGRQKQQHAHADAHRRGAHVELPERARERQPHERRRDHDHRPAHAQARVAHAQKPAHRRQRHHGGQPQDRGVVAQKPRADAEVLRKRRVEDARAG